MHIRAIWAIRVAQLAKLALAEYDCLNWMKKQKCALAKRCRRICRNNRSMVAAPLYANKYRAQRLALHSPHYRVLKSSIHKQPKNQPNQMQSIFQIHLGFYPLDEPNETKIHYMHFHMFLFAIIYDVYF